MSKPSINGIDVSECEHHYTNPVNGIIYHGCAIYEQKNELGYWQDTLCEENPDCYFKQLKRLQEENEELKKLKCKFKEYCTCDIEKYRSALEEIREMFSCPCVEGENCFTCNSTCSNKDVLNITERVLNDRN